MSPQLDGNQIGKKAAVKQAASIISGKSANELAATGRIDRSIPAKAKVVEAIVQPYATKPEALQQIAASLREAYPDPAQANQLIEQTQAISEFSDFSCAECHRVGCRNDRAMGRGTP